MSLRILAGQKVLRNLNNETDNEDVKDTSILEKIQKLNIPDNLKNQLNYQLNFSKSKTPISDTKKYSFDGDFFKHLINHLSFFGLETELHRIYYNHLSEKEAIEIFELIPDDLVYDLIKIQPLISLMWSKEKGRSIFHRVIENDYYTLAIKILEKIPKEFHKDIFLKIRDRLGYNALILALGQFCYEEKKMIIFGLQLNSKNLSTILQSLR